MRLRTVLLTLLLLALGAPAARAADEAVVNLFIKGAGTFRVDTRLTPTGTPFDGRTCGDPDTDANLANPTDTQKKLCTARVPLPPKTCGGTCDVYVAVQARKPNQLTDEEKNRPSWVNSGWIATPDQPKSIASGCTLADPTDPTPDKADPNCVFRVAHCEAGACTVEPPVSLVFALKDTRAPVASFACRGACDRALPLAVNADPTGTVPFRARSDEYAIGEFSTLLCALDGAEPTPCPVPAGPVAPSAFALTGVPDGEHTLAVRAKDPSGNVGPAVEATFAQRYPPVATITGGPQAGAALATGKPQFSFAADRKATFQCRFDAQEWVACVDSATPAFSLGEGPHTFSVRASRTAEEGGVQGPEASRGFSVDLEGPQAQITSGPENGDAMTTRNVTFAFKATTPDDVTFRCRLDGGAEEVCTGGSKTYAGLPAGTHTFTLTAFDPAGNGLPAPLTRTWTVIADADGDGFYAPANDCDDRNAARNPGAREIPGNGVDEDCDGTDPPDLDVDGDGFLAEPQGADCDDRDPARHPGADDLPENGVDEDCDEIDALVPRLGARLGAVWRAYSTYTLVAALTAEDVPAGTTIRFTCQGRCPRGAGRVKVARQRAEVPLKRRVGRRIPVGARLTVTLSKPGRVTEVHRFRFRSDKAPVRTLSCRHGGKARPC